VEALEQLWPDADRRHEALLRVAGRVSGRLPFPERGSFLPSRCELSPYERRVLMAIASGLNRDEAATVLGYTLESVKDALRRVRRILGAKTTAHAVAVALRTGVIE
jgi:DNA-binding CsgD family transcriptional regulator